MKLAILLIFFFIGPGVISQDEASMVEIYAKVASEVPSTRGSLIPPATCVTNCLNNTYCILAYMDTEGYCLNYNYSDFNTTFEIVTTLNTDGFSVAVKINKVTCPKSYTELEFTYVDSRNDVNYPFQWTKTETGWTLLNPCPEPGKIFRRSETVVVCLQIYSLTGKIQSEASAFCESQGKKMSGIANANEKSVLTNGPAGTMWVDGTTTCQSKCKAADYTFTDGYTNTTEMDPNQNGQVRAYCLTIGAGSFWVQDCSNTDSIGVVCGSRLP
ncbi:hypothetical protein GCK72_006799 [Caenorhabditis remanei]|uniref:PAN-3 domain-containing protein n=1 Tax=Caenorhabditis remanei TaxID=31234 RepID=A0A6A5HI94_CAERE|nr:hypothetical protein GCK72_006799 [Caenorhabditis remanei]KAF1766841.1 hypothetical protein GCK72_006799 [Caenorhabditis remanei]